MEVLQLLLNIVGITGVTCLSLICFMVKRDNQALATEVRRLREQIRRNAPVLPEPATKLVVEAGSEAANHQPASPASNDEASQNEASNDEASQNDISRYVAQRSQQWASLSVPLS